MNPKPESPLSLVSAAAAVLMLGPLCLRAVTQTTPLPFWELDPLVFSSPMVGMGPALSVACDAAVLMGAVLAMVASRGRPGLGWWMVAVLAVLGAAAIAWHGWMSPTASLGQQRIGSAWLSAWGAALGLSLLCRERRWRVLCLSVLLGLLGVLVLKGAWQMLIEHPATVASFRENRDQILAAQGWTPDSPMAKGYQRRLEQNEPTAWFGLSNVFASLAAAGVAAFGGLAITAWQQLRARSARFDAEAAPRWPFALACAGLVVSLAGVAMSQSKGGAGSAVVGLAVLGVLWWLTIQSRRSLRAGASLLGPALVCAAMGAVVVRGMVGLRIGELSLLFRWFYMQAAWRITGEHLPWGVGPDGFKEAYLLAKNPLNPEEVQSPHCLTWDWLACLGWGGACWLGAFVVLLVLAGRAVCRPEFAEPRAGESSDEPFSMTDSRPWIRCVLVVPVVATFGSLLLETAAMTPENALLRIGCLVVWCALSATALVVLLPSVRAIAWRVGLAGSAIALAVHTQIEVTGVSVQACGLLMSFVAIAAAPAGNAEPARAEGPRRVPGAWLLCLPLAAGAVLLATSSARLFAWEDGLRRAATHLAPIAEAAAEFAAARSETDSARRSGHLRAAAAILEPIRKVSTPDNPAEIGQALDAALDVVLPRGIESLTAAASAGPFDWATVRERSRLQLRLGASMASRGDKAGAAAQFERALACGREAAARAPGALASWRVTVLLSWRGMVPSPAIADRLLTELDAAQAFDPYSTTLALHRFRVLKAEGRPPSEVAAAARHLLELDDYQRLDRDVRGLSDKDRSEAQAAVGK